MEGIRRGVHVSEIGRFKRKNSFVESWILNPPLPTVLSSLLSCKEVTSMCDSIRSNKAGVHMPNSDFVKFVADSIQLGSTRLNCDFDPNLGVNLALSNNPGALQCFLVHSPSPSVESQKFSQHWKISVLSQCFSGLSLATLWRPTIPMSVCALTFCLFQPMSCTFYL